MMHCQRNVKLCYRHVFDALQRLDLPVCDNVCAHRGSNP